MQFKVVSALAFATLVAAGAVHTSDNTNPNGNTNTPASTDANKGTNANKSTNNGNTNANIVPPFAGNPPPTISASKCTAGHLKCCDSAQSATAADVISRLKTHGIDSSKVSGYVGVGCSAIPVKNGKPGSCSKKPVCCSELYSDVVVGCNLVNL